MQSFHTKCRIGVKLYSSPPEAYSIDLKYLGKAHTCLLKGVTVHMHVGAKNQAMKFKKFPTDRSLLRHRSEEEDKKKAAKALKVPRSIVGSITEELSNLPKPLFLELKLTTLNKELQKSSAKIEEAARRTTISAALHHQDLYWRVVTTKTAPEKKPHDRLEFAKRCLKDSESMKEKYSLV